MTDVFSTIKSTKWWDFLSTKITEEEMLNINVFLEKEYIEQTIFPKKEYIFKALKNVAPQDVKVVLLGQDPYHDGSADGLSFSTNDANNTPPSLRNIKKELLNDLHLIHGNDLSGWSKQGVLLLNTSLTVQKSLAESHSRLGIWDNVITSIIEIVEEQNQPIVYILWGKHAQKYASKMTNKHHLVLKSAHPSPFSANKGFFGSKPFSKTNEFLAKNKQNVIVWGK